MFEFKKLFTFRNAAFVLLFIALAAIADNIKVSSLWGAPGQSFTLFQVIGPLPGLFLGPVFGVISVLGAELVNFVLLHKTVDPLNLLRLLPMLGGAYYFATYGKNKYSLAIPLLAILLFNLNPIGVQAWVYSLYWLIPLIAALAFPKSLFFRALGTTFTAHSIGGAFWGYFVTMTPAMWLALIPVTAVERLAFAIGITVSYLAINAVLNKYFTNSKIEILHIEKTVSVF